MDPYWSFITPYARALLVFDADPDTTLQQLADDLGSSYRWVVMLTSQLLAAGYLQRERHGRTFSYLVTRPAADDTDRRSADALQLAYVLGPEADAGTCAEAATSADGLRAELDRLRHEVVLETQRLRRVQVECRHLEATIERARSVLRHPALTA